MRAIDCVQYMSSLRCLQIRSLHWHMAYQNMSYIQLQDILYGIHVIHIVVFNMNMLIDLIKISIISLLLMRNILNIVHDQIK